jgi:hypothetical protein
LNLFWLKRLDFEFFGAGFMVVTKYARAIITEEEYEQKKKFLEKSEP